MFLSTEGSDMTTTRPQTGSPIRSRGRQKRNFTERLHVGWNGVCLRNRVKLSDIVGSISTQQQDVGHPGLRMRLQEQKVLFAW